MLSGARAALAAASCARAHSAVARAASALAFLALALAGCSAVRPLPVVQNQTLKFPPGTLEKVAVVPFTHRDTLAKYSGEVGSPGTELEFAL